MMRNASLSKQQDFLLREAMHLTGLFTCEPAHLMWKIWVILVHCCFFLHPFLTFQFLGALKGKIDKERSVVGRVPGMVLGRINSGQFSRCWWHEMRETHSRKEPQLPGSPAPTFKGEDLKAQSREVTCPRSPSKWEARLGPEPRTPASQSSLCT